MTTPLLPVHVQRDEDAALGAAWRRAKAAGRPGERIVLWSDARSEITYAQALHPDVPIPPEDAEMVPFLTKIGEYPPSPRSALEALADALESRE